jgi:hypothetical protein
MSSSDIFSPDAQALRNAPEPVSEEKPLLPPVRPLRIDSPPRNDPSSRSDDTAPAAGNGSVPVFKKLVNADDDLVGLIAYGLYKQNKYEWLAAFEKSCGRRPGADEFTAYALGEGTPRRVTAYRSLAETFLSGRPLGPELPRQPPRRLESGAPAEPAARSAGSRRLEEAPPLEQAKPRPRTGHSGLFYALFIAALAVVCVWLLVHSGFVKV